LLKTESRVKSPRPKKIKKRPRKPPKGYDSWLEWDLHEKPLKGCRFHTDKIKYTIESVYNPDFVFIDRGGMEILIESKGRFRDSKEAAKYIHIRRCLKDNQLLVFVFSERGTKMPHSRRRKDGTYYTMEEWAEKNNFEYFYPDTVPRKWSGCKK